MNLLKELLTLTESTMIYLDSGKTKSVDVSSLPPEKISIAKSLSGFWYFSEGGFEYRSQKPEPFLQAVKMAATQASHQRGTKYVRLKLVKFEEAHR